MQPPLRAGVRFQPEAPLLPAAAAATMRVGVVFRLSLGRTALTIEGCGAVSRWQDKVADQIAFIAPALLLLFFGIQDIALTPPDRTDPVGGVLWIVAGLSLVCLWVARNYGRRTPLLLALALVVVSGTVAVVWKIVGLVGLWRA